MRFLLLACAVNGLLAVALGAFGAHGLADRLATLADGARRLEWWRTAAQYQLVHALALGLAAWLAERAPGPLPTAAGWAFLAGIVLFSGSLYAMTVSGVRALGVVTPVGGVGLLAGWCCLILAAWRMG